MPQIRGAHFATARARSPPRAQHFHRDALTGFCLTRMLFACSALRVVAAPGHGARPRVTGNPRAADRARGQPDRAGRCGTGAAEGARGHLAAWRREVVAGRIAAGLPVCIKYALQPYQATQTY